jgi:phage tail P2-like protein
VARLTPSTAGAFARAMDEILDRRITQMVLPIKDVFDPDRCPLAILPWLAWHRGLTYWSSAWPEHVQRRVVREAADILRRRGTRRGLERQLEALGSSANVVEWFEETPEGTPGTWRAVATLADGIALDATEQDEIAALFRRTAPLTRPWTIDVGVYAEASTLVRVHPRFTTRVYMTAAASTVPAAPDPETYLEAEDGFALLTESGELIELE